MKSILIVLFFLITPVHKFYVSLSEIRFNPKTETLEIATKIFIDDLESCISSLKIGTQQTSENEVLIATYLLKEMSVKSNDQLIGLSFLGYEVEDDVVWCYIESDKIQDTQKFELSFTFLLDELEQQTNIIHFEYKDDLKTVFLNADKIAEALQF